MNPPSLYYGEHDEDDDEIFLEDDDILQEIIVDDEDLPDVDEDSDGDPIDETDDSIHTFTRHERELYAVACSPIDVTLVATGGRDNKGFLWSVGGGWVSELQGHTDSVSRLAFSSDGQLLASGSCDGYVQVWYTSSRNLKCKLEGPTKEIEWLRWYPRGHYLLAGSGDFSVWMWNAENGMYLTFEGHGGSVTCGDFTPDGKFICTGSDDATMRIWDTESAKRIHIVRGHSYQGLTCLSVSPDSVLALIGSKDGSVHVVNIITGKVVTSLSAHSESVECVAFSASSSRAATGGMDGKLIISYLQNSSHPIFCEHEEGVTCLSWLGASRFVATGSLDGKVRIWDSRSEACVRTFSGHTDAIQSIAISANGHHLVSAAFDRTARAFDIAEWFG